jgi:hypothetical protein
MSLGAYRPVAILGCAITSSPSRLRSTAVELVRSGLAQIANVAAQLGVFDRAVGSALLSTPLGGIEKAAPDFSKTASQLLLPASG